MSRNLPTERLVLLVEDNEDDAFIIQRAFKDAGISNPIHVAKTGEEAIEYLAGTGPYCDWRQFPLPVIVLLDLGLPGVSGFEVLAWIRHTPELQTLRVVVLTGSCFSADAKRARELGANDCFAKLGDYRGLVEMMKTFGAYWLQFCRAPEVCRPRV